MKVFASLIGYRTIVFNVIMGLLAFAKQQGWITAVPDASIINQFMDAVLNNLPEIIAAGNVLLRFITKGPVGVKP
jgi:hypothetical protein